jgi:trehalose-6-phosphate synthase
MEAFVVLVLMMKEKVQIVVEHDDEVDEVQKQVEVVNELVEEQNYYYSLIEPLHPVVVVEEEVSRASLVEISPVVEQVAS